jgi:hypothetical protein
LRIHFKSLNLLFLESFCLILLKILDVAVLRLRFLSKIKQKLSQNFQIDQLKFSLNSPYSFKNFSVESCKMNYPLVSSNKVSSNKHKLTQIKRESVKQESTLFLSDTCWLCLQTLCLSVLLCLFFISTASAQQFSTFKDPQGRFSLKYPSTMTRQYHTNPSVVFFAKMRDQRFPTLTITEHSGYYAPRSSAAHIQGILSNYRNVGFVDVKAVNTSEASFLYMPKRKNSVVIGYTLDGYKHLAEVTYVSAQNTHFIITYVDTEVNYSSNALLRDNMVRSFDISRNLLGISTARNSYYNQQTVGGGYAYGGNSNGQGYVQSRSFFPSIEGSRWFNSSTTPTLFPMILVLIIVVGAATLFKSDKS